MRWMQVMVDGQPRWACVEGAEGGAEAALLALHEGDPVAGTARPTGQRLPLAGLPVLPPGRPGQVIGLWNNVRSAAEKNGWAQPPEPLWFFKSPHAVTAHGAAIPAAPAELGRVAYEGELAVVIGRPAFRLAREEAAAALFGYTVANDISAIELLNRDASFPQWSRAKSLPGFAPLGPWIDTAFDPGAGAEVVTRVGGRERQRYALSELFFGPVDLVWRLSQELQLMPGDVILCGTGPGVLPMKPGTEVEVSIAGLGALRNVYG